MSKKQTHEQKNDNQSEFRPSHPYRISFEWSEEDFYQDQMTTISRLPTPEVVAEKTEVALRATMATIQDIGERIATTMHTMPFPPDGVELEFGIRLGAERGVITKDNETAHFIITLSWKDKSSRKSGS